MNSGEGCMVFLFVPIGFAIVAALIDTLGAIAKRRWRARHLPRSSGEGRGFEPPQEGAS